jgi:DNA invertase Pin-like site-specific DNA recombinase
VRAVTYLRVSTDEQGASGAELHAQLDVCRAHAERAGWDLAGHHSDEAVSGAAPLDRRPALLDALAAMEPGDVLLVAKRDRLGRDPIAVAMIEAAVTRKGGRVVSAAGEGTDDDGPTSILMRRMVDAFAEYERLVIKARTRAAMAAKRRRGERVGTIPFGSDLAGDGRTLLTNDAERRALAIIHSLKAEGLGLRAIAARLDALSIPTKTRRGQWSHAALARILARSPHPETPPCPSSPSPETSDVTPSAPSSATSSRAAD